MGRVRIQQLPFDLSTEVAALQAGDPRVGAACSFVGTVRHPVRGENAQDLTLAPFTQNSGHPRVTQAFCRDCNRARLSTEGQLYLCLFASRGHDLRSLLRKPGGVTDEQLQGVIAQIWRGRSARYSELRATVPPDATPQGGRRVEMSYIGG